MKNKINNLEIKLNNLNNSLSEIKGQFAILNNQIASSEIKLKKFEHNKEIFKKSIELLTIVEQNSKTHIKKGFEDVVNFALAYILNDDKYRLVVEFGRRGNLQAVDFNILTPGCSEPHKPGGFVSSILSLALRIALIELTRPKIEGFICFDEPFDAIDNSGNLGRASEFLKNINQKLKRQMIIVSHKQEFIDIADTKIQIGD